MTTQSAPGPSPYPTSAPAEQGVDAGRIAAFLDAVEADPDIEPHGLIIQRHGLRIVEGYWAPHDANRHRLVYSLSKTFTGTALAIALGDGLVSLDDLVADHLPEYLDGADERTRRMRIRHIASMATGHDREILGEALVADRDDPLRAFFRIPPDAEPGSLFAYNQPPVLALAAVLERRFGRRMLDVLRERVLDPVGIGKVGWAKAPTGTDLGFSGVYTNLDAIARLGQLYLDDGMAAGRRLLPEGWVADASSVHVTNEMREVADWQQGYGFQLWMSQHGYRGDGAFGQYMLVLPAQRAVIAMFSCVEVMQKVMDLFWAHVLPAMGSSVSVAGPADAALAARLASMSLPTVQARLGGSAPRASSAMVSLVPGEAGPTAHRSITRIDLVGDDAVIHEGDASLTVPLSAAWTSLDTAPIASCATHLLDGRIRMDLSVLSTPHRLELTLDPTAGTFTAEWPLMPLFGAGVGPRLSGMHAPD